MLLSEENRTAIRERFEALDQPVVVEFFETTLNCDMCPEVKQLLEELVSLSDLLTLEVHNLIADEEAAKRLSVDQAPFIHITDDSKFDTGIYFYGAPSGYEFATLLEDILMVSRRDSGLKAATKGALSGLTSPVELDVFVTPTCPYCPAAVHLAHQFAYESEHVVGKMVESTEFPEWAGKFNVYGVPKTVMNQSDSLSIEGAVPEHVLLERVLDGVGASA